MGINEKEEHSGTDVLIAERIQATPMRPVGRRSVLKKLAAGTAAVAGLSALPDRWAAPLVEFGSLPAHATTSATEEEVLEQLKRELEALQSGDGIQSVEEAEAAAREAGLDEESIEAAKTAAATDDGTGASIVEAAQSEDLRGFSSKLTINNTGAKISIDKIWRDKFVFPKLGPEYGPKLLLVWSDGRELYVHDSSRMTMLASPDGRKYQPGGPYSGNNPDIPTMEVYAAINTSPASVTLYY